MPSASLSQYTFSRGLIVFGAFALYILDYDLRLPIYSLMVVHHFCFRNIFATQKLCRIGIEGSRNFVPS
jgi:hypothetical protein